MLHQIPVSHGLFHTLPVPLFKQMHVCMCVREQDRETINSKSFMAEIHRSPRISENHCAQCCTNWSNACLLPRSSDPDCMAVSPQPSIQRGGRNSRARRRSWRGALRRRRSSWAGSSRRSCGRWSSGCRRSTAARGRACRSSTGCSWSKSNCSIRTRSVSASSLWRVDHASIGWAHVVKYIEHSPWRHRWWIDDWKNILLTIFTAFPPYYSCWYFCIAVHCTSTSFLHLLPDVLQHKYWD